MATSTTAGSFVWHELMTTDQDRSIEFYKDLFDWRIVEKDMGQESGAYRMFYSDDEGVGGTMPIDPSDELPSHWITYISVDNVDEACNRAKAQGGEVVQKPFDVPEVGRMAVVKDATGAFFSPFKGSDDRALPTPRAGLISWHELLSTDVERANAFYADVVGWSLNSVDMGENGTYWLYRKNDQDAAGAVQMPDKAGGPSNWLPYIGVTDVPGTAERARAMGGTIYVEPTKLEEPANVHFAVLASPDGAMFGIMEMS